MSDPDTAAGYYTEAGQLRTDSWIPPYNLACLRAISGDTEAAMRLLADAMNRGFHAPALLDRNEDFDTLRTLAGWTDLVARAREMMTQRRATPGAKAQG
jgi:hypothetical protein